MLHIIKLGFGNFQCILRIDENTLNGAKWNVLSHSNIQYELHIALKGSCKIDVEREILSLSEGESLLIPPGQYHSTREAGDDYEHFVLSFLLSGPNGERVAIPLILPQNTIIKLSDFDLEICRKIIAEYKEKKPFWQKTINSMYSLLMTNIFRKIIYFKPSDIEDAINNTDRRFEIIDDFFENDLSHNPTEEKLAEKTNLSKRQLNRILKAYYGMSFREKLYQSRIERAEYLLRTTNTKISKICELSGYSSETSFFKLFKQKYGVTPGLYRKTYKKKGIKK